MDEDKPDDSKMTTAQREQRRARAIESALGGASYQKIADEFGYYDRSHARRDIREGLKEVQEQQRDNALALVDMLWARYERLLAAHWPNALLGDADSTNAAIRITVEQTKLKGLAAPVKVDFDRVREVFEALTGGADSDDAAGGSDTEE